MTKIKEDPTVEVVSRDFFIAQERWVGFWGNQGIKIHSFGEFLGLHKRTRVSGNKDYMVSIRQSSANKIRKLNGPHWYAILKAYQIKKCK